MSTTTITYEDFAELAKKRVDVSFVYAPQEPNLVVFVEGQGGGVVINLAQLIDFSAGGVVGGALMPGSVAGSKLVPGSVSALMIGSHVVQTSNEVFFVSGERTATGGEESIAHNMGFVPTYVAVVPTDLSPATVGVFTVTEGDHDATNCKVTVTANKKYKVLAWV